ncbi:MAG TPA: cytidylate kinase-like family protein [Candidatus Eisenbergiella intestinipullorum]|nr:cytidylate kinase-like family protein [Candidatus Eisenbergiella intestinipullorum]
MQKRLILTVSREFGSGGHVIAEALARRFELDLYDNNLLEHIAEEKNVGGDVLKRYDERPKNRLFSRTVRGYSNSIQENVANMQFDYLKKLARDGKSFVVVGRCSETILKGYEGLVSIFVLGDREVKRERIMRLYRLSAEEAEHMMARKDWERKSYHNYYCKGKWGDSRNYDLSINSSRLGIDRTVDLLEAYVRARMEDPALRR